MTLQEIAGTLPSYAKDLRLNLTSVLATTGAPGLNEKQIWGTAVATAAASGNADFAQKIETIARTQIDDAEIDGARAAAAIMGMNNVYYRFVHLVDDADFASMPARLRMNVIGSPGIDKTDFELYALAVSAINSCEMCVQSHYRVLRKAGVDKQAVQSAVRIASVIRAVAGVLETSQEKTLSKAA